MYTPEDGEAEPDWVQTEKKHFAEFRDINKVRAALTASVMTYGAARSIRSYKTFTPQPLITNYSLDG